MFTYTFIAYNTYTGEVLENKTRKGLRRAVAFWKRGEDTAKYHWHFMRVRKGAAV